MAIEAVLKQLSWEGNTENHGKLCHHGGTSGLHAFGVPGERRLTLNCSGNVELLVHYLDLLIDHLPRKPIDRGVYPVMLFTSTMNLLRSVSPRVHRPLYAIASISEFHVSVICFAGRASDGLGRV